MSQQLRQRTEAREKLRDQHRGNAVKGRELIIDAVAHSPPAAEATVGVRVPLGGRHPVEIAEAVGVTPRAGVEGQGDVALQPNVLQVGGLRAVTPQCFGGRPRFDGHEQLWCYSCNVHGEQHQLAAGSANKCCRADRCFLVGGITCMLSTEPMTSATAPFDGLSLSMTCERNALLRNA